MAVAPITLTESENLMTTARLSARGLLVGHRGRAILPAATFEVAAGSMCALVGRNGSGKTTLLRTLLGLLPPVGGEVIRAAGGIGYVAQRSELIDSVPARAIDLVRGGWERGWSFVAPARGRDRAVDAALRAAGCADVAKARYAELSEGQKQRVLLARALACTPDVLVLDEPSSAMDSEAEAALFDVLDRLRQERGLAVLVVSHQLERLLPRADAAVLVDGESQVVRAMRPEALPADAIFATRYPALAASWGAA